MSERDLPRDGVAKEASSANAPPRIAAQSGRLRRLLPTLLLAATFVGLLGAAADRVTGGSISELVLAATSNEDRFVPGEKDELARAFSAQGPIVLERVKLADLDRAIGGMQLSAEQERLFRGELAATVARENPALAPDLGDRIRDGKPFDPTAAGPDRDARLPMAWITLWDHKTEDGDVVRVVSNGYARQVPILHQHITLAIPLPTSGIVNVVGLYDGGGGITLGLESGALPVALPVLAVGQAIGVPVTVR